MALIVQKYGGTSMACIERVADRVIQTHMENHQVVVVVSAQAGVTDGLLEQAKTICTNPNPRELDLILSTGEQVAMGLLTLALQNRGYPALALTSAQIGLQTDGVYNRAKIKAIDSSSIKKHLYEGKIVILPGFQGVAENHEITTLGRGGSDTSAVAISVALKADKMEIYTDVDGIYSADPRVVKDASKIKTLAFDEMLEMAGSGAKVLHLRSVELAAKNHMPIHLRSTFVKNIGTMVKEHDAMEEAVVRGVAHSIDNGKITLFGIKKVESVLVALFEAIAEANIVVDVITQSDAEECRKSITFTIPNQDFDKALQVARDIAKTYEIEGVRGDKGVARVSVIGVGMKSSPGVASKVFKALEAVGVSIQMITTSNINISCLINQEDYILAVNAIHKAFQL